jgi:hypothetical protein
MAGKKSNHKELRWRNILNRQANSGLSVRRFCAQENVSEASFYAWRRKLRERKADDRRSRKSGRTLETANNGGDFIPLELLGGASALEVIHPLGCRIRVRGEVDGTALRHVLDVLDGRREQ